MQPDTKGTKGNHQELNYFQIWLITYDPVQKEITKSSLITFKCSLLQKVQKENTKTSLITFKCNLIQKVQKEIIKSSLITFKCSLFTYDPGTTPPPPPPIQ